MPSKRRSYLARFMAGVSYQESMRAIFKNTEGDYLEATIEVDSVEIVAMDEFGGEKYEAGEEIDVRLSVGLHYDDEEWESMFSGNPKAKKELERQSGWRYRAYGIVSSIEPEVMVDVGIVQLSAPIDTSDPRVIGESIAFTIQRLDAHSS